MAKKEQKVMEPQYYMSAINTPTYNYKVYYMKPVEKVLYFILAFVVGAVVGYLFYGGIGKDSYGEATIVTYIANIIVMVGCGFLAGKFFVPIRTKQIMTKRKKQLRVQFLDLLDSLSASLSSGKNVPAAFMAARDDLEIQYPESAFIVQETELIVTAINNNIAVETMLSDLGARSGIKDISNFGRVFEVTYAKGGNLKEIIRNTYEIMSEKCQIEMEIETKIASSKNEQSIMIIMPILLVGMLKMSGGDFADNFATPTGLISTTIAIATFVVAYLIGQKIMKIEV